LGEDEEVAARRAARLVNSAAAGILRSLNPVVGNERFTTLG